MLKSNIISMYSFLEFHPLNTVYKLMVLYSLIALQDDKNLYLKTGSEKVEKSQVKWSRFLQDAYFFFQTLFWDQYIYKMVNGLY